MKDDAMTAELVAAIRRALAEHTDPIKAEGMRGSGCRRRVRRAPPRPPQPAQPTRSAEERGKDTECKVEAAVGSATRIRWRMIEIS